MEYRNLNITFNKDCDENTGGYFCEVFISGDDLGESVDTFCIHQEELEENSNLEVCAKKFIDSVYDEYLQCGIVPSDCQNLSM